MKNIVTTWWIHIPKGRESTNIITMKNSYDAVEWLIFLVVVAKVHDSLIFFVDEDNDVTADQTLHHHDTSHMRLLYDGSGHDAQSHAWVSTMSIKCCFRHNCCLLADNVYVVKCKVMRGMTISVHECKSHVTKNLADKYFFKRESGTDHTLQTMK